MKKERLVADWQCTADIPQGTETGVHVWKLPLLDDHFIEQHLRLLDDTEQKQYSNLPEGLQKQVFASHRLSRRLLLSRYAGLPPDKLVFGVSATGKPLLLNSKTGLHINSSHSAGEILLAVSGCCEVGIDVEKNRLVKNWQKIAERVFPKVILETLTSDPRASENFIQGWTEFEAIQKCRGLGVFGSTPEQQVSQKLKLWRFKSSAQYQASLAVCGENRPSDIRFLLPDTDSLFAQA